GINLLNLYSLCVLRSPEGYKARRSQYSARDLMLLPSFRSVPVRTISRIAPLMAAPMPSYWVRSASLRTSSSTLSHSSAPLRRPVVPSTGRGMCRLAELVSGRHRRGGERYIAAVCPLQRSSYITPECSVLGVGESSPFFRLFVR